MNQTLNLPKVSFPSITRLRANSCHFLDSAATAQKSNIVIAALASAEIDANFPAGRSLYPMAEHANSIVNATRQDILAHLNAEKNFTAIFCSSATDGFNLLANGIEPLLSPQQQILLSTVEHHSNLAPWLRLGEQLNLQIDFVNFPERGFFLAQDFADKINGRPQLLAITLDSNVVGPVWEPGFEELKKVVANIHAEGGMVVLDASQAMAFHQIDLQALDADFLLFSGHKFGGPHGVGVLVGKTSLLEKLNPWRIGGGNVQFTDQFNFTFSALPERLEAGSLPVPQIMGLKMAFVALTRGILPKSRQISQLCAATVKALTKIKGIKILGNTDFISQHGHLVSFEHEIVPAHDLGWSLGQAGVFVRSGFHCAEPLHQQLKSPGSVRASFFAYNDLNDVKNFIEALERTIKFFTKQLQ